MVSASLSARGFFLRCTAYYEYKEEIAREMRVMRQSVLVRLRGEEYLVSRVISVQT